MAFLLAFKNIVSRKSSYAIILFIAFSISLLVVSNAFFDGTGKGIEKTFVSSFTGDVVIRPKVNFPLSLLGDETPATGAFSEIPQLIPYTKIFSTVESFKNSGIECVVPQLSGQTVINTGSTHTPCVVFGVEAEDYLRVMDGINLKEGTSYSSFEKGILMSSKMISKISESSGYEYKVGDTVQLLCGNGISYSLRAVTLTGIYEYSVPNEVLDRICLISPQVLRELKGISATSEDNTLISENQNDLISDFGGDVFNLDDLFGEFTDEENVVETEYEITENTPTLTQEIDSVTSWNYLVCKLKPGVSAKRVSKKLNKEFKKNGYEVQAVTWRSAAGLSAMYLYWIHNIFTAGILVLLAVGFIIVNNTLTVSALDRIHETGTLRAVGAEKKFIRLQFASETFMLTITAGIIGFLIGLLWNWILNKLHITFSNTYLIQLFGGSVLQTEITFSNFIKCMALSVALGFIGWIYPVKVSMEVSPVQAMQRSI
ncbi:MAG: FtsX-like permease family protein [Treponema sp.]|nr:FtsX-like permease family protein [Treponema sp.]